MITGNLFDNRKTNKFSVSTWKWLAFNTIHPVNIHSDTKCLRVNLDIWSLFGIGSRGSYHHFNRKSNLTDDAKSLYQNWYILRCHRIKETCQQTAACMPEHVLICGKQNFRIIAHFIFSLRKDHFILTWCHKRLIKNVLLNL
jgi:hypothetical protein